MGVMKTPGVYIVEKDAFPNSVVEVATAVPAFIGYTEKAETRKDKKDLVNKPWRISSLAEFHQYFGFDPDPKYLIQDVSGGGAAPAAPADDAGGDAAAPAPAADLPPADFNLNGKGYILRKKAGKYLLYYSMMLFFQNGGGPCYVVSVGDYTQDVSVEDLTGGIDLLVKEQEPTMVVTPDAVLLKEADCIHVQQAALMHCGGKMKNRFAILDIHKGYRDRKDLAADKERGEIEGSCIDNFRNALGINYLAFGAAYYPWINTSIISDAGLGTANFTDDAQKTVQDILNNEIGPAAQDADDPNRAKLREEVAKITDSNLSGDDRAFLDKLLKQNSPAFNILINEMKTKLNLLPPSAAMAGIYTMVDNASGVWKAPANVSLNSVISPAVTISHDDQEDLNVTPQGKSINAIRAFIGEGTLVWGARTLDGNSLDWRYIQVRRTMIMLEESIRLATKAYVFENNVANTWVTIKSMIRNFLTGIWKRGGLAGASPDDAFSVHVGLGETMTPEDILEGILRVTVLVALVRPAEFIEITFQQQMQKS